MPIECPADHTVEEQVFRQEQIRWPEQQMAAGTADPELGRQQAGSCLGTGDWSKVQERPVTGERLMTSKNQVSSVLS